MHIYMRVCIYLCVCIYKDYPESIQPCEIFFWIALVYT